MPINKTKLDALKSELNTDPATLGYPAWNNAWEWVTVTNAGQPSEVHTPSVDQPAIEAYTDAVYVIVNNANRPVNKSAMSAVEIFEGFDDAEYDALTAAKRQEVLSLLTISEDVNPFGRTAKSLVRIFGGGSVTVSNLAAARNENVTRGAELGLGHIHHRDIRHAQL